MILKTKTLQNMVSPQAIAGQKQEQNVAFFLRRAFKDNPEILVINDFKFSFNDETAQIDHLIVYPYGFVLIESKSIKGHVKVNQQQEWTRSYNNQWSGIPSPIKQVELQQDLFQELLDHHRLDILEKFLGIKQGFGGRCWDHLCVISSNAVIDRKTMPKAVSEQLVKTEFLVDKLLKMMKLGNKLLRKVNVYDTRPYFNQQELDSIGNFILSQHIDSSNQINSSKQATSSPTAEVVTPIAQPQAPNVYQEAQPIPQVKLSCKHCGESTNYIPMYGKFGYYIKCNQCTKNTPMKQACPMCHSKNTKVQKRKETYSLNCQDCSYSQQIV
ncbi:nuclease-related domain-containing protein [Shewanella sp. 1_MG-2023]|uniref:nuclease-related domain-containing protein n=1 Tax=unclassified Shewanella TaxID=196818 RepID=UPI0026E1D049|nr:MULTISPECIES: nuclease-related domain-containing protein [unclassified Shewanella]MDO6610655.1 nuclease-related domain-containing protein [Shewanella sp. 7_MG-2023]MDO6770780.1 nuclease-related domain-containing protein [Shewanella sp. 2_MG-2023]MDO6793202.1 nuclease-related domain-containing protein [Shewanella sp. 1_MG-2023]